MFCPGHEHVKWSSYALAIFIPVVVVVLLSMGKLNLVNSALSAECEVGIRCNMRHGC